MHLARVVVASIAILSRNMSTAAAAGETTTKLITSLDLDVIKSIALTPVLNGAVDPEKKSITANDLISDSDDSATMFYVVRRPG